ncbi:MAG: hypothetical protein U0X39_10260, partial [Bacteroidales bacterium]
QSGERVTDTLQFKQLLYRGTLWQNNYRRYKGDQFFLSNQFLPADVFANGSKFEKVRVRYDILNDELLTPLDESEILQLNKEMIDSFTVFTKERTYRFINFRNDSINGLYGYYNIIFKGKISLVAKYSKILFTDISTNSDGEFGQLVKAYAGTSENFLLIRKKKDLYRLSPAGSSYIRDFISKNRLKISTREPISILPAIRYLDDTDNQVLKK